MWAKRTFDTLKWPSKAAFRLGLACALWLACSAVPAQAQFSYQDLYDFPGGSGGCNPQNTGYLTQIGDGSFDGTVSGCSASIYNLNPFSSTVFNSIYSFAGSGSFPMGSVVFDTYGNFYTVASLGGANGFGYLYGNISGVSQDLHDFTSVEGQPQASPVLGKDGNLYGITLGNFSGPGIGSAYTVVPTATGSTYQSLGAFAPGLVYAPLFLAADGYLYGTSYDGGTSDFGTVFRMSTPSGAIKEIFHFDGKNGATPYGPLVQDLAGNFYGTTFSGGKNDTGVVFKITPKGAYKKLFDFDSLPQQATNNSGAWPTAGLTLGADGNLYGVAAQGGVNGSGTIFQISTTGAFNKIIDFTGNGGGSAPGGSAVTGLALNSNGIFYGLTSLGGANGLGDFFSLTPVNLKEILIIAGPIFVLPGVPVEIFGNELTQSAEVTFGGVQAQFQVGSDTYLTATVPMDAVDGLVADIFQTGLQVQTLSAIHILPLITNLDPSSGPVGTQVGIVGGGFSAATKVAFGGVQATDFTVVSPSFIQAVVPPGAKSGKVRVMTPNGDAESEEKFVVN